MIILVIIAMIVLATPLRNVLFWILLSRTWAAAISAEAEVDWGGGGFGGGGGLVEAADSEVLAEAVRAAAAPAAVGSEGG